MTVLMLFGAFGSVAAQGVPGSALSTRWGGASPVFPAAVTTEVTIESFSPQATLPGSFWGTTAVAASPLDANASLEVNATPAREVVFPGGYLADEMDLVNGTIHGRNGGEYPAATTTAEFVKWCESIGCHAIFEVPGEINSTSTAAAYVRYVEQTLHYHPDYWEIGNEPGIWTRFNLPWSEWAGNVTSAPTPAQYAYLVHQYIAAMRAVDPTLPIIGFPGTGKGAYIEPTWLSATVQENGPNLSAVAIHVYPGGLGPSNASDVTLAGFLDTLTSSASLPVRFPPDLAAIRSACPSCGPIPIMVTEFGSAIAGHQQDAYIGGFPQAVYIAAELIQAAHLSVADMAYWSMESNSAGAWFPIGGTSKPVYQLYAEMLSRLGPDLLPTNVSSSVGGVYALATEGSSSSEPIDLLVDNTNATHPISFSTAATGLNASGPMATWSWNGSSAQPVARYWPNGLPATWQQPAASLVLFEQPEVPSFPLTITESGMPTSTRWYVGVGNVSGTSNTSEMTFFLPNGQYNQTVYATQFPEDGERIALALPATVTIDNAPVTESGTYGLEYRVEASANPSAGGTASPAVQWVSAGTAATIAATTATGYEFLSWQGSGPGNYTGSANPASFVPQGPNTEVAEFGPTSSSEYSVTFDATGLPGGTTWSVRVGSTDLSGTSSQLSTSLPNGSYTFTVAPVTGFTATPSSGTVNVTGAAVDQSIAFAPLPAATYPVWFNESGLPSGTSWSVSLNGTLRSGTGGSISFTEANGTYAFQIGPVTGYAADPSGGSVTVDGTGLTEGIRFDPVPTTEYAVTFQESGLPAGTLWAVTLGPNESQGTTSSIAFAMQNGTYPFTINAGPGYLPEPANGSVTVDGSPTSVAVNFTPATVLYSFWFNETGLPSGTSWTVSLGGTVQTASTGSIRVTEPAGTYAFSIASVGSWVPSPSVGNVTSSTTSTAVAVSFTLTYSLTFDAPQGLPSGSGWTVTLANGTGPGSAVGDLPGGGVRDSTGTSIIFWEPNGTYSYTVRVSTDPGYLGNGSVTIHGDGQVVTLPPLGTSPLGGSGTGGSPDALLLGAAAGAVVVALGILLAFGIVRSRRRRRDPPAL